MQQGKCKLKLTRLCNKLCEITIKVVTVHCFITSNYEIMSVSSVTGHADNVTLDVTVDFLDFARELDYFLLNFTNRSDTDPLPETHDLLREIPLGIVLTLLCLVTSVGNAMVLHAVRTERRLQTVSVTRCMLNVK